MRQVALPISIVVLTFFAGIGTSRLVHDVIFHGHEKGVAANRSPQQFIPMGSLLEPDYHIYWYKTLGSSDTEEINLYGDFRSAQVTRETLESNANPDGATLIERGTKFDEKGRQIGERVVTVFKDSKAVRISWTEGDIFWSVQAPSLELAREFEESEIVSSITMSNKRLQPTPR